MDLAKNDDMIQALAADRPDQPFGKAILPDERTLPKTVAMSVSSRADNVPLLDGIVGTSQQQCCPLTVR